jgi:hypothetical protein
VGLQIGDKSVRRLRWGIREAMTTINEGCIHHVIEETEETENKRPPKLGQKRGTSPYIIKIPVHFPSRAVYKRSCTKAGSCEYLVKCSLDDCGKLLSKSS